MLGRPPTRILPLALVAALGLSAAPARAEEPSRWIAALPFGAGQIQNGDVALGIFFGSGEAVLGATSIVMAALTMRLASVDTRGGPPVDVVALNERIAALTAVNRFAFASWAALTAAGILEAQINFGARRPDSGHQRSPSFGATVAPVLGGGLVGVRAVF